MRCSPFRGPKDITSSGYPLVAFASSSKTFRTDAVPFRTPPLRFLPLRRVTSTRQPLTPQKFQELGYVAFSAFQRSQGFAPPGTSRFCFIPGPPMGFPLGDLLHPKITVTLRLPCPPAVHFVGRLCSIHVSHSTTRSYVPCPSQPLPSCRAN